MSVASLRDKSLALRHTVSGLAVALSRALDPIALAADVGMDLDPWQGEYVSTDHKRVLVNCHRQSGKSTLAAIRAVHRAIHWPGSLILIISPTMRQSGEVLQKCIEVYHASGKPVVAEAENQLSLILENGSRIISLPGSASTVRGYSGVDAIIVDESAFVKDEIQPAVSPMLAVSGGEMSALSTPFGKRGWWWDAWENGGPGWLRFEVPAYKLVRGQIVSTCPRIETAYLREQRLSLGQRKFEQEFGCRFIEIVDQAFSPEQVSAAFDRTLEPIQFDMPEA